MTGDEIPYERLPELCQHELRQLFIEHDAVVLRSYEPGVTNIFDAEAEYEEEVVCVSEEMIPEEAAYFECPMCLTRWNAVLEPGSHNFSLGERQPYPFIMPGKSWPGDRT